LSGKGAVVGGRLENRFFRHGGFFFPGHQLEKDGKFGTCGAGLFGFLSVRTGKHLGGKAGPKRPGVGPVVVAREGVRLLCHSRMGGVGGGGGGGGARPPDFSCPM